MAPPDCIQISEELLTEWAMSCVHINHLGTLIQRELAQRGVHARAVDLAERAGRSAWALRNEFGQHGARNSDATIENPKYISIPENVAMNGRRTAFTSIISEFSFMESFLEAKRIAVQSIWPAAS